MRLGFVGTGTIASAVVQGLADDGHVITVSERGAAQSAALAARHDCVRVAPNQGVVDASDTLFLGLLPAVAPEVLRALRFRPEQTVISFMADLPLEVLADLVAPARAAAIVLPFPGIARGGSPLLVLGDRAPVDSLFGARNTLFVLRDAAELDAFLCAQAVLSPAAALVGAAGDWLAEEGNEELAVNFLAASFMGWQFCRDNFDACVQHVLDAGPTLGASHMQWQLNEINKLIWPSPDGIGIMDQALWDQTVEVSVDGGVITEPPGDDAFRTDLALEAHKYLSGDVTGESFSPIVVELREGGE